MMNSQNNNELEILKEDSQDTISKKKKMKKPVKILLWIAGILVFIIIAILITFWVLHTSGKNKLLDYKDIQISLPQEMIDSTQADGKTLYYKGEKYTLNENITNILCMGVDKKDFTQTNEFGYGTNGQADSIFLVAFDTVTAKTNVISVSRETMVDVDTYSSGGEFTGTKKEQICLAYFYGNDEQKSCNNVKKSISRYFYGLPVNSYFSFDFQAVSIINDAVGGVTVTPTQDVLIAEKKYAKAGQAVTLNGSEALKYVRTRDEDINANNRRMERQVQYVKALSNIVTLKTKDDILTPVHLFNKMGNNVVSDIDTSKITYLTECFVKNNLSGDINFVSIEGATSMGEEYVEFKEDKTKFFELILSVFYNKAQ